MHIHKKKTRVYSANSLVGPFLVNFPATHLEYKQCGVHSGSQAANDLCYTEESNCRVSILHESSNFSSSHLIYDLITRDHKIHTVFMSCFNKSIFSKFTNGSVLNLNKSSPFFCQQKTNLFRSYRGESNLQSIQIANGVQGKGENKPFTVESLHSDSIKMSCTMKYSINPFLHFSFTSDYIGENLQHTVSRYDN